MAMSEGICIRVWEFQTQAGLENEFERIYGPDGHWEHLFRKSKAFLRTELYRDIETNGRYVTVDYFVSQAAFQAFLKEFGEEYEALDQRCEAVCASEKRIGSFANVSRPQFQ
jgi:heme-degrading monooxygenase HmoA